MGCLRCGGHYMEVVGKELHCPKCGHIQGGKVVDNVDLIESSELAIWDIINKMHKAKVRYSAIYFILTNILETLELQSKTEEWVK